MFGWKIVVPIQSSFSIWKWQILSISPLRGDAKKCYHVNDFSRFENGHVSQHRPQEVMQKKCYHVNAFSQFENGQVSQHRPQQSNNATCVVLSKTAICKVGKSFTLPAVQWKMRLLNQNSNFHQHRPHSLCRLYKMANQTHFSSLKTANVLF